MPNNNLIYWEPPVRKEKKNSLRENKYLNMPDLSFFHGAINNTASIEGSITPLITGFMNMGWKRLFLDESIY